MTTRAEFAWDLLSLLGIAPSVGNVCGLISQMSAENTTAAYNPMATTMPWEGATNFNAAGVRNYASLVDGLNATVATLNNGDYANILVALRSGSAGQVAQAWAASPWGTEPFSPVNTGDTSLYDHVIGGADVAAPPAPALAPAPAPPTPPDLTGAPELRPGSTGWAVGVVQVLVHASPVDGLFGPVTTAAVETWQQSHEIAVDGVVGPQTWAALLT